MNKLPAVALTFAVLAMCALSTPMVGCRAARTGLDPAPASLTIRPMHSRQPPTAVRYPTDVIGLWVAEGTDCPTPDREYVADRILEIQQNRLVGYEEVRTPVAVTRLADGTSWRIEALVDVGPSGIFAPDLVATYVLERGVLTIQQAGRIERYRHCPERQDGK